MAPCANAKALVKHFETLHYLTESEVKALKRSWSYRLGRILVFPASLLKSGVRRLMALRKPSPAYGSSPQVPSRLETSQDTLTDMRDAYQHLTARPLISILVPVYNTPSAILRQALDSVLQQVYHEWELCLADDGSTNEETLAVLEEYGAREPQRIKLVRLSGNRGILRSFKTRGHL